MKKFLIIPFVLVSLSLIFSSCRVGQSYQQPALQLPAQFDSTSFADTSSIADINWKNFFTDTNLLALVDKGLQYNQDLLIAVKRIEAGQQLIKQARLLQLPELTLVAGGQYNRPSKNSLNGLSANNFLGKSHIENYAASLNLSWEADIWGKIRGQKEVTLWQYLQTREAHKAIQTRLVADIADGYFQLQMLDQQLVIANKNLALSDSFLTATRLLKSAGTVTELAVQQAESQRQTTALLLPALGQAISLQENALQLLTGQLPGTITRSSTIKDSKFPALLNTGLPIAMVARRPDVRNEELALKIATRRIGIAQANMYPALNITAGAGLESFKSSNWFSIPNSLFGLAAGTILQPVFQRRELKTKFEIAKLEREEQVIRFRQTVLQASTEVANALVKTENLASQQAIAIQQVQTLNKAVSNAQLLFRNDMANYLEVITAQSNALQAELNYTSIQRDQLSAIVELYRSLGGGWSESN